MAAIFNALGLTLRDVGFVKFNLAMVPMTVAAHLTITTWMTSSMGTSAVAMIPVPPEKVPFFVIAVMPVLATLCAVTAIMGITIYAPKGYQSQNSRQQKAPGALGAQGLPAWLDRMQGAQYNTWEACTFVLCSFFVATSLNFPKDVFAKLAALFLACRLMYPFFYVLDIDLLRTQSWFTGVYALCLISFGALFPDTVLPLLA